MTVDILVSAEADDDGPYVDGLGLRDGMLLEEREVEGVEVRISAEDEDDAEVLGAVEGVPIIAVRCTVRLQPASTNIS